MAAEAIPAVAGTDSVTVPTVTGAESTTEIGRAHV